MSHLSADQPNCIRRLYLAFKDATLSRIPGPYRPIIEQEFNPLFTFVVAFIIQMRYLLSLMGQGSVIEANFLKRFSSQAHIAILLVGGVAIRCLLGYIVSGGWPSQVSSIFDYPGHSRIGSGQDDAKK